MAPSRTELTLDITKVLRMLDRIGNTRTRNQILSKALREATKPMIKHARAGVVDDTGLMRLAIGNKVKVQLQKFRGYAVFGVRFGVGFRGKGKAARIRAGIKEGGQAGAGRREPGYYAHLVERGTRRHGIRYKKVMSTGDPRGDVRTGEVYGTHVEGTRPRPFIGPAFARNRRRALQLMAKKAWAEIRKTAAEGA